MSTTVSAASARPATPARLPFSLRQLEVFVALARHGSTRAAAERVARSQSAASNTLMELEAALGTPLFDRVGRRLALNDQGRALLPRALTLLDEAADLARLPAEGRGQPLRLAASLTIGEYLLPPLLAQWRTAHGDGQVQLTIGNSSAVLAAVANFDVDLGFIEGPQTHPDIVTTPWLTDEMVIVAAPNHPYARRAVTLAQLQAAPWALRERGSGTRDAADRWLLEHLGPLDVAFEIGSPQAIKHIIGAGAALGCLSRLVVAQALKNGTLVELQTSLPRSERRLALVTHRSKSPGRSTVVFLDLCRAVARPAAASQTARAVAGKTVDQPANKALKKEAKTALHKAVRQPKNQSVKPPASQVSRARGVPVAPTTRRRASGR